MRRVRQHAQLGWTAVLCVQLATCDKPTLNEIERRYAAAGWNVTARWNGTTHPPSIVLAIPERVA